jgi:hypothetical protein
MSAIGSPVWSIRTVTKGFERILDPLEIRSGAARETTAGEELATIARHKGDTKVRARAVPMRCCAVRPQNARRCPTPSMCRARRAGADHQAVGSVQPTAWPNTSRTCEEIAGRASQSAPVAWVGRSRTTTRRSHLETLSSSGRDRARALHPHRCSRVRA